VNTQEKQLTVNNRKGIHGRIAARLIKIANKNKVRLNIIYNEELYDCSSVLDILSIALVYGATFKIRIVGKETEKAMSAVENLINARGKF
jgi:phosphocarrier protein HPr